MQLVALKVESLQIWPVLQLVEVQRHCVEVNEMESQRVYDASFVEVEGLEAESISTDDNKRFEDGGQVLSSSTYIINLSFLSRN